MARTATPPAKPVNAPMNEAALAEDTAAMNQLAVIQHEADERVHALAVQLNYQGSTDPAVLENSARDAIQRIGMGIFELGGYLLLMKEACGHGKFLPALERLGLEPRVAQQYMTVTRRFANTKSTSHLGALGVTKLVELLPLDDEQLVDLTGLGETGELALDKAATMSVRELRATVREMLAEKSAEEEVRAGLHKRIDKLEREKRRVQTLPPDEALAALKKEAASVAADAEGAILGGLRQALIALRDHGAEPDAQAVYMAGLVGQVQAQINALRDEFRLADVSNAADRQLAADMAEWDKE